MGRLQKVKGFPTDGRKRHSAFPHQSESLQHFFDRKTSARQTAFPPETGAAQGKRGAAHQPG